MNMNTLTMVHRMLEEEVKKTDRAYAEARCLYYKAMDEGRTEAADDLRVVKSSLFRKHAYAEAALADFLYHDFFSSFEVYEGPAGPEGEKKYIGSTSVWDQALTAVKSAAKRNKFYLVLGVRDDGTHAWIDTWEY